MSIENKCQYVFGLGNKKPEERERKAMEDINELIERLAKQYDLDKTDTAFIRWYTGLSKEKREDVMPILMTSVLNMLIESKTLNLKKNN